MLSSAASVAAPSPAVAIDSDACLLDLARQFDEVVRQARLVYARRDSTDSEIEPFLVQRDEIQEAMSRLRANTCGGMRAKAHVVGTRIETGERDLNFDFAPDDGSLIASLVRDLLDANISGLSPVN